MLFVPLHRTTAVATYFHRFELVILPTPQGCTVVFIQPLEVAPDTDLGYEDMTHQVIFQSVSTGLAPIVTPCDGFAQAAAKLAEVVRDCKSSAWFNNDHCYMHKVSDVYYKIYDGRPYHGHKPFALIYIKRA